MVEERKLRPTAYLDGLRGLAAFAVYTAHSEAWNHDVQLIQYGFGYKEHYSFITLPFVRVFFTGGHSAVAIFFVISGFVLSQRPLQLIKRNQDVYEVLSSAVFRRPIRLFMPFIAVTFIFLTLWHIFSIELEWPKPQPTYFGEVINWWNEFTAFTYPFKTPSDAWFTYDFPLWTIPIEFQGSILVFVTLLAFSRIKAKARIILISVMAVYFLHCGGWQMTCFLSGMILAETDYHNHYLFLPAMYLASQPAGAKTISLSYDTPGWYYLTSIIPPVYANVDYWRFWATIAAPMIVASVSHPFARTILESRFPQYLGRISFALYLVHIPIAGTIGDRIFRMTGFVRPGTAPSAWDNLFPVPAIGPLGLELSFLIPQMIILPITLYISELATRAFDEPSMRLGKWAYEKVVEY